MLLYSIPLHFNETLTEDTFIALAIQWNQVSSHRENVVPELNWSGEHRVRFGTEEVWLGIKEVPGQDIIAIRYSKQDPDGTVWTSDFVANFRTRILTVQLNRQDEEEGRRSPWTPPFFPRLLINRGYLEEDGILPVLNTPTVIREDNLRLLTDVINRRSRFRLPVVYVSRTCRNEDPLRTAQLAYLLKGAAHVLVEESNRLDRSIRLLCEGRNEYYGAAGIYFPQSHRRYLYQRESGPDKVLFGKVFGSVVYWWKSVPTDPLSTWDGVSRLLEPEHPAPVSAEPEPSANADDTSPARSLTTEEAASPMADVPQPSTPGPQGEPERSFRDRVRKILSTFLRS